MTGKHRGDGEEDQEKKGRGPMGNQTRANGRTVGGVC